VISLKNIRFIKEPGYIYDLLFIFTLYFNEEYCYKNFINYRKSSDDLKYFKKLLEDFGPISDDLLLFFYINLNGHDQNIMSEFYFDPHESELLNGNYNFTALQTEILKHNNVIDNVLKYYFNDASDEVLSQCKSSLTVANTLIRESGYDDRIKNALYSFLIDPASIIQRLSYELMTKEFMLSKQYENHYPELIALQEKFEFNNVSNGLKYCCQCPNNIEEFPKVFISFCYNNKNHIRVIYYNEDTILLTLGVDYADIMKYLSDTKITPKLHEFGTAISEKNRVAILQLIHDKNELSIKEVEQTLDMAGTNAYYHLSLMIRTGMLKTRNQGRTVLYSINHNYFDILSKAIKIYSKEKE